MAIASSQKTISTWVLIAMLLVGQILGARSAEPNSATTEVDTVEFKVGMPLYRDRKYPEVLIPAFKVDSLNVAAKPQDGE